MKTGLRADARPLNHAQSGDASVVGVPESAQLLPPSYVRNVSISVAPARVELESQRGKCGGMTRERFTHARPLAIAVSAFKLLLEMAPELEWLTDYKKIERVSKLVRIEGTKSAGVNPHNLWRWTRPDEVAKNRLLCENDPLDLNEVGVHKGGRGKRKSGEMKSSQTEWHGWFEDLEELLDDRIKADRKNA